VIHAKISPMNFLSVENSFKTHFKEGYMLKNRYVSMAVILAVIVLVGGSAMAQGPDLQANITGSVDSAATGETVSYEVALSNIGDAESGNEIILDIYLPGGVPTDINAYLNNDPDAVAAYDAMAETFAASDDIWDEENTGIFFGVDSYCENFLLQPQKLVMPAGVEGVFVYDAVMPETPLFDGFVHLTSASMDADVNYGRGGCEDGGDCHDHPCLGPRISTIEPVSGTVELVSDGSPMGKASQGCNPLQNFTAGNIALVDRGTCVFEAKVANALFAGAVAVIIADHGDFTDSTTEPDDVLNMACTDFCSEELITIPAVFISYADGQVLHSDLATGVTASIGKKDVGTELTTIAQVWENGTDEDLNQENNRTEVTTMIAVGSLPVAGFTYEATGLDVVFTDTTSENPTTWAWDFGDGSTSEDQNPSHSFAADGTYTVSLTASNGAGSDTYTEDITLSSGPAPCTPIWVAAAAAGAGANDSMWSSDLGINNSGDTELTYKFQFLPWDTDNSAVDYTDEFTLQADTNANFQDIWKVYTGEDGAGAINVCVSDLDAAGVFSRTYNTSDAGTFGQGIVGMKTTYGNDDRVRLGFLSENDAFHSNLGFMNASATSITINAEFFAADGTTLGTDSLTLLPYSGHQWNQAFTRVTEDAVDLGYVDVWTITSEGQFLTYASVIDNATSDATTVMPFDTSVVLGDSGFDCTPIWVAAAASAAGAEGTQWATDLGLNNLGDDALNYRFQFLPRDADNTAVEMGEEFTLAAGQSITYSNIWAQTGAEGAGAINVCVDNGDAAGVITRTYNTGDAGTFGQTIVGMRGAAPAKIGANEKVRLGYLFENDAYRTNIGFANAGANEITVHAEFFDMQGNSLGTKDVTLLPYSNTQLNHPYTDFGGDIMAGFVDVWSEDENADFLSYASIVDNGTGDPTTVWPF